MSARKKRVLFLRPFFRCSYNGQESVSLIIIFHTGCYACPRKDNIMSTTYGYARVSSADQNEARQIVALTSAGIDRANIFVDHKSGKDFNRPAWRRMRRALRAGDTLVIQSLDRLGRNYSEMLDEWRNLIHRKKINIRVLDMPILDTTNKTQGLIGEVIAEIVLQLLSFIAENERRTIRERQRQGIAAAKERGVQFGRPKRQLPPEFAEKAHAVQCGKLSAGEASRQFKMNESTFRYHIRKFCPVANED